MNDSPLAIKRALVGILSLVCLAVAAGLWVFTEDPEQNAFLAAVSKVGIMLAALWLALPRQGESVAWERLVPVLVGTLIFVALAGRALRYLLPVAFIVGLVLFFLRPRPKRHGRR
ncbi:MAG: hypothetical protein EXS05_21070 [Planctomycetaceae bacterium]|nr:hypothetical protein [Planctomycetaceae bacterium]